MALVAGYSYFWDSRTLGLSNGATVTSWVDSVASAAVTNNGTPTFEAVSTPTGEPAIVFNHAGDDWLEKASGVSSVTHLFIVAAFTSSGAVNGGLISGLGGNYFYQTNSGYTNFIFANSFGTPRRDGINTDELVTNGQWAIYSIALSSALGAAMVLGNDRGTSGWSSDLKIAAVLAYSSNLSSGEILQNEAELASIFIEVPPLTITTSSLPDGIIGVPYSQPIVAMGGSGSLAWSEVGITSGLPDGLSLSSSGLISGTPSVAGTFSFTVEVEDSLGATDQQTLSITIEEAPPLPYGFTQEGVELFCEANQMSQSNGTNATSFTDISLHSRHLTAPDTYPTFQTNVINSKPVIRWNGSQKPLSVTASFRIRCGWILAKFNGTSFSDYKGLLSDLINQGILVSNNNETNWFNLGYELFEYRLNDRIYPESAMPAPMNEFKLIFFRFWKDFEVSGIRLGQDRDVTGRKWNGDVPLLILCSGETFSYNEEYIRARSEAIASAYALTLANVYPYQADKRGTPERPVQSVNFYDPPEGDRISEVLDDAKRELALVFTSRLRKEAQAMKAFHATHYAQALPCIYRNYKMTPPEDLEGYIDSPYEMDGYDNNFSYKFTFKEK